MATGRRGFIGVIDGHVQFRLLTPCVNMNDDRYGWRIEAYPVPALQTVVQFRG